MTENRYKEIEGNVGMTGDSCSIAGTLNVTGVTTLTGGIAALKLSSGPTGTTHGAAWTTGLPAFTTGQSWCTYTAGSTTFRWPVWANS